MGVSWCLIGKIIGGEAAAERRPIPAALASRIHGLLLGGMIGDALGGPVEFQDPNRVQALEDPPKTWAPGEVMDHAGREAAAARLRLRSYRALRPDPEPYAHWTSNALPGTVTDDSRHKLVLLMALHETDQSQGWPIRVEGYARAHETFYQRHAQGAARQLCEDWLLEWVRAARWVQGARDLNQALPPERLWGGLPTCCGQMSLPPLAALYPGDPEAAYRAAYYLAFFDNGFGKDLNAALIAGLSQALVAPVERGRHPVWKSIWAAMKETDPYAYEEVPWVTRPVDRWLSLALAMEDRAQGQPHRLFQDFDAAFRDTIKWEAQVPFVVAFACLALCDFDPLASLQLSIEWGHDTDSYAALVGCFVGALHGVEVFPAAMRDAVEARLLADYGVNLAAEAEFLFDIANRQTDLSGRVAF